MSLLKLPDLGEGLPEAEIVSWSVQEGDIVKVDQILVAMETAKAIVDIPSPQAGVIAKLFGAVGDIIQTGEPLLAFADSAEESQPSEDKPASSSVVGELPVTQERVYERAQSVSHGHNGVKAAPAVRALASHLDVDLSVVTPSGPNGTIKVSDVERVAKLFAEVGPLEPLKGVRRTMANTMTQAHEEVVAVTINDDADISHWSVGEDINVRLIKAMVKACIAVPELNSWYDSHSIGRRLIKQVHLGLAVDSEEGLFVPIIRDAQNLAATALREKIDSIVKQVKARTIAAKDLRGHTITLSNFGSIGGKYANPVVVPPTVAILGAGRCYEQLQLSNKKLTTHRFLPLSLSFDHRSVTGGEAGRFLQILINDLQQR